MSRPCLPYICYLINYTTSQSLSKHNQLSVISLWETPSFLWLWPPRDHNVIRRLTHVHTHTLNDPVPTKWASLMVCWLCLFFVFLFFCFFCFCRLDEPASKKKVFEDGFRIKSELFVVSIKICLYVHLSCVARQTYIFKTVMIYHLFPFFFVRAKKQMNSSVI